MNESLRKNDVVGADGSNCTYIEMMKVLRVIDEMESAYPQLAPILIRIQYFLSFQKIHNIDLHGIKLYVYLVIIYL